MNRPNLDFRGYAGTVASGRVAVGDEVVVVKSGRSSRVKRIVGPSGDLDTAGAGEAITLVLQHELDISRGDMLAPPNARPDVSDRILANLVWFDERPLLPGQVYVLRTQTDQANATVTALRHRTDVNSYEEIPASSLQPNEVGVAEIRLHSPMAVDSFADNRETGAFILIDRITNRTAAAGMIMRPLRQAANIHWQALDVDRAAHAAMKHQKPAVFWFTGLSGSGKSTIANLLEKKLHALGRHTYILDGDNVRHGLNRDLGFSDADRAENIRRVAEVARLMVDAGLIVLVSFISPFRAQRRMARELFMEGEFVEVFVDAPIEECARRDRKGLYAKAARGEIRDFTGVGSPYEPPEAPELRLHTVGHTPEELVEMIEQWLHRRDNSQEAFGDGSGI